MRITVIGGSGMVGSRIVSEAVSRKHDVIAGSRSGTAVAGAQARIVDLGDTGSVVELTNASDVTVISVAPDRTGGSHEPMLEAHRALIAARPSGRIVIVGGAGSLEIDGVKLKDMDGFPPEYKPEADTLSAVLELYRASSGVDWTVVSPAPIIAPGERTGAYVVGSDSPAGDTVSAEDFACAVLNEVEKPSHRGERFTVAS